MLTDSNEAERHAQQRPGAGPRGRCHRRRRPGHRAGTPRRSCSRRPRISMPTSSWWDLSASPRRHDSSWAASPARSLHHAPATCWWSTPTEWPVGRRRTGATGPSWAIMPRCERRQEPHRAGGRPGVGRVRLRADRARLRRTRTLPQAGREGPDPGPGRPDDGPDGGPDGPDRSRQTCGEDPGTAPRGAQGGRPRRA